MPSAVVVIVVMLSVNERIGMAPSSKTCIETRVEALQPYKQFK